MSFLHIIYCMMLKGSTTRHIKLLLGMVDNAIGAINN